MATKIFRNRKELLRLLEQQIIKGEKLLSIHPKHNYQAYKVWDDRNKEILKRSFSTDEYYDKYCNITYKGIYYQQSEAERLQEHFDDLSNQIGFIDRLIQNNDLIESESALSLIVNSFFTKFLNKTFNYFFAEGFGKNFLITVVLLGFLLALGKIPLMTPIVDQLLELYKKL
jgi:hypothetical protein